MMYATKRRQRVFKRSAKDAEGSKPVANATTNPSKRHRERLNCELDNVAALLPFEQPVITKLDKLSVLRLAVAYLQTKTHFQGSRQKHLHPYAIPLGDPSSRNFVRFKDEDDILKTLHGFVMVLSDNGDIFYVSSNIDKLLGFHQSDILHQSVFELIHSEDRQELKHQLSYSFGMTKSYNTWEDILAPENQYYMERNFTIRFRCLLDNTCGFLRLDIKGRLDVVCGLSQCFGAGRTDPSGPVLGLFAVCSMFVPPVFGETPENESLIKTKHSLNLSITSLDLKAKSLFEVSEDKGVPFSLYSRLYHLDLDYVAESHREVIKTGVAGFLVYRILSRDSKILWVQSSARLYYKNGKPESISLTTRTLTEFEGVTLLEKRSSLAAKLICFGETLSQPTKSTSAYLQTSATGGPAHSGTRLKAKKPKCPQRDTLNSKAPRYVPPPCHQFPLGYQSNPALIGGQSWFSPHQSPPPESTFSPYYFAPTAKVPTMFTATPNFTSNSLDCGGYLKAPVISQPPNYGRIDYSSPVGPPPLAQCGSVATTYRPDCRSRGQFGQNSSQLPIFSGYSDDNSYQQGPPKLYKFKTQVDQMDSLHMSINTVDYFSSMIGAKVSEMSGLPITEATHTLLG